MERTIRMKKVERRTTVIIIAILVAIAFISLLWISGIASSEDSFQGTYNALDEKRTNVTELMGVTAASSTAISLLPGDAGTPIAEQLADLSGYFMFILAAIYLEKWMVTITGMLAFKILIPVACGILILAQIIAYRAGGSINEADERSLFAISDKWKEVGVKLILFGLMIFAVIPVSGIVTEKIDASYQQSVQQTIEDTRNDAKQIQDTVGQEKDDNVVEKLFNKVKGGVAGQLDKFENTLNRITEAIAVLIVTSCAIPLAVLAFFIWLIKLLTGVNITIPRFRASKLIGKMKMGFE